MGKWNVGQPGGPNGPFWSVVSDAGEAIAMQIPSEVNAKRIASIPDVVLIEWTRERPTTAGHYVYQADGRWPLYIEKVSLGRWQQGQNPEWLYAGDEPLQNMDPGLWYGPIPEPGK